MSTLPGAHAESREGIAAPCLVDAPARHKPAPGDALLARFALHALIDEAELTPKPALVDGRGSGVHRDLDLATMRRSAYALEPTFAALARSARERAPGIALRTDLALIGRAGESAMLRATGGSNAHRGAIWVIGLLVAGAALTFSSHPAHQAGLASHVAELGAQIARFPDLNATAADTNGERVRQRYQVGGARREAEDGFPHVLQIGLPALHAARARTADETSARIDALLAIMASLDDTCVLHRAGLAGRDAAQRGARRVLAAGGFATRAGRAAFDALEASLVSLNASPGGAADLLAATLFIDKLLQHRSRGSTGTWNN